MNTGIYVITSPSGRKYVGSAVDIAKRWATHRHGLRRGKHHCAALQNAYAKYGERGLTYAKLLVCAKGDLLFYEQRAIDSFGLSNLYNCAPLAGNQLGFRHSEETRTRYSETRRGRKLPPRDPAVTQRIANARRGGKQPAEFSAKQSAARRGVPKTAEHVEKVAAANRGKKRSPEMRAALSAARANQPTSRTTSGFVGVSKKGDVWQARASIAGRRVYLGYHATPEAANAVILAAISNGANP